MLAPALLDILKCPTCGAEALEPTAAHGRHERGGLRCTACQALYDARRGIPDLTPRGPSDGLHYRTESLYDAIAGVGDVALPLVSLTVWRCPPLRYIDWAHRAMGRARGGRLLVEPVGTGFIVKHVQSVHTTSPIIAVDVSWKMLFRAAARFRRAGLEHISVLRARPDRLPFRDGAFSAVFSVNGVNGFTDRQAAVKEWGRVTEPGGSVLGSALCRGLERVADTLLRRYERMGLYPTPRSRDFLVSELTQHLDASRVTFETHGAAVFYCTDLKSPEERSGPDAASVALAP